MAKNSAINLLSSREITDISAAPPTQEEQKMLDAVTSIDSLTIKHDVLALYRLASLLPDGSKILEIGSYKGASALAMGRAIKGKDIRLYCIDMWASYLDQEDFVGFAHNRIDDRKVLADFMDNTAFLGDQIKLMRGKSTDFASMLAGENFDLIFIDGAHDYASIRGDILLCMAALKPGSLMTGHDFHSMGDGVRRAVNELLGVVPSIEVKGVIEGSYIWYAKVEQPEYELALTDIADTYAAGSTVEALKRAFSALSRYKTEELSSLVSELKSKLAIGN